MKQLREFATAQDARDYKDYKQISSNKAEQFFSLTGIIAKIQNNLSNVTEVTLIEGMPTNIGNICQAIINTTQKANAHFEVDPDHPDGQMNQAAINALVTHNVINQTDADAFIAQGYTQPYKDVSDEDWQAAVDAHNFTPLEIEVIYPSETYIVTTANQGIDVLITGDKDCKVTVYLAVCNDTGQQHDAVNFIRYEQPVGYSQVKDGKGILSLSSRKVRQYNKLFVIADNDAVISATVQANRG